MIITIYICFYILNNLIDFLFFTGEEIDKLPSLKIHIQLQSIESKDMINERNASTYHYSPRLQLAQSNAVLLPKQHNYFEGQKNHSNVRNYLLVK